MPIDTEMDYNPHLDCPIYTKIVPPEHNKYELFSEYEVRIPDEEQGEDGPYNYVFEAILIGKEIAEWSEIPGLHKAYTANTRDGQEAMETIHPLSSDGSFNADDELVVLVFLRKDETKEFITSNYESLLAQNAEVE